MINTESNRLIERWTLTLKFRWYKPKDVSHYFKPELQQMHFSNLGNKKWVTIPTVIED